MNVSISKAKITDLTYYGIRIDNGTGLNTNVSSNDITTATTGATAVQTGIMLYLNNSTLGTSVNGNYIYMQNPSAQASYGIHVGGYPASSPIQPSIANNYIYMANAKRAFGITLSTVEQHIASGNNIYFNKTGTSATAYGIYAGGSPSTTLSCNHVYGQSTNNLNTSNRFSVYTIGSNNYLYQCNTTDSTYEGFYFTGTNFGLLQTDSLKRHYNGLHITSSSMLGQRQFHEGNLWLGTYGNLGALHENTIQAPHEPIIYNCSSMTHFTNNNFGIIFCDPSNKWFIPDNTTSDQDCNTNNTCR